MRSIRSVSWDLLQGTVASSACNSVPVPFGRRYRSPAGKAPGPSGKAGFARGPPGDGARYDPHPRLALFYARRPASGRAETVKDLSLLFDGKYEILAKIREGGSGAIYEVRHRPLNEI